MFNQKIKLNTLPVNLTNLTFGYYFNQKIEPNTLPDNLTTLTFGYCFNQGIEPNILPEKLTTLTFGYNFNQEIDPNTLPENLTTLIFGCCFDQIIKQNVLPNNLTTLTFGYYFNQLIEPNTLSNNLTTLTFGCFDQKIEPIMLPFSLKNIKFNWTYLDKNIKFNWMNLYTNIPIEQYVKMVNNIPNYYHVEIFLKNNIIDNNGPKWPIHIVDYIENKWSPKIYEIQDKYMHPIYGSVIILINKETYQPYSSAKTAIK